ncbi:MAG TPA: BON domain-containing protein [Pyrinomonadaceae bacterium]|nr:BON domain-containing protein [Pyrinomonadaceae bacterium]
MSYDEEQQRRSRVVVETPNARREVVQSQTVRYPEERRGYSVGVIAAVALTAIAATVIIMLFLTNPSDDSDSTNINLRASAPAQPTPYSQVPVIVQTPMTQPTPIIIQQPAPVIVAPPPATTEPSTAAPPSSTAAPPASAGTSAGDDLALQQKVDRLFADDREVAAANIFATVVDGRVRLTGTVASEAVKQRAERLAYSVKGVLGVDNKITVTPTP